MLLTPRCPCLWTIATARAAGAVGREVEERAAKVRDGTAVAVREAGRAGSDDEVARRTARCRVWRSIVLSAEEREWGKESR